MTSPLPGSPIAVCVGYLEAFVSGDPDAVAAFVTDDFVNEHTAALGSGCVGIDEYRQRLPGVLASMPGLHYVIDDVMADHDRVIAAYTLHTRPTIDPSQFVESCGSWCATDELPTASTTGTAWCSSVKPG